MIRNRLIHTLLPLTLAGGLGCASKSAPPPQQARTTSPPASTKMHPANAVVITPPTGQLTVVTPPPGETMIVKKPPDARVRIDVRPPIEKVKDFATVSDTTRGTVITLPGELLFRFDESTLLPTAKDKLDQVASALKEAAPDQNLMIEGHADSRGTDDYNRRLSERRAEAVRTYLIGQGVPAAKLAALGKGEKEPIASNADPEGRANNRRVEIVIGRAQTATRSPKKQPMKQP